LQSVTGTGQTDRQMDRQTDRQTKTLSTKWQECRPRVICW